MFPSVGFLFLRQTFHDFFVADGFNETLLISEYNDRGRQFPMLELGKKCRKMRLFFQKGNISISNLFGMIGI